MACVYTCVLYICVDTQSLVSPHMNLVYIHSDLYVGTQAFSGSQCYVHSQWGFSADTQSQLSH